MPTGGQQALPIQPVDRPILCSPYVEPAAFWRYDELTGAALKAPGRRPASYFYRTEQVASGQRHLFAQEQEDPLPLVNKLREDVRRWRVLGYEGATPVTKELLRFWRREDRPRRLFFCQLEAVETVVYLAEIRKGGKRTRFNPAFGDDDLAALIDVPAEPDLPELTRFGCKMATGSGKTVVMAMLVSWALCNRGRVPSDERFPAATLVCCPNLTVKERLQVLRPDLADNYYAQFDLVPTPLRPLLQGGKVLVTNWHRFAPESPHAEGGKSYAVVNKGPEGPEAFARRVLGELYDLAPLMVLNDEGHHAYRPVPLAEKIEGDEAKSVKEDREEATVWVEGLDRINLAAGVRFCVDLSATPFYIHGSGYPEGRPFPWLVSDFGLVDAIESGIVKIPRLPISDTTGRPEPRYFRLWQAINEAIAPAERLPGKARKPKPEAVYREAEAALRTLASQWVERFGYVQQAAPGQERVPPVLIIVCDNTDIAEVFYRNISGERTEEVVLEVVEPDAEEDEGADEGDGAKPKRSRKKAKTRTVYGNGKIFPEYFANTAGQRRTLRIDSKLLAAAESEDPSATRQAAAEELRRIVATVGRPGEPGEHIRCVVSVGMLTEGWDANNVTHILGVRAFASQLLSEQVVGRGLRRMDYTPDPETGLLTEEYVDVYGIPFSVIPFKGRETTQKVPEDRPKHHVRALPERKAYEIRFPVVEGYAFALRRNVIKADVAAMEPLRIEPAREPTALFVRATVGYQTGGPSGQGPGEYALQNRQAYYDSTHLQAIEFDVAHQVVNALIGEVATPGGRQGSAALRYQSRHQLFPQVLRLVKAYVARKVDFAGENPRELGHERYVRPMVERLVMAIEPDDGEGEAPLLPILNRYKPYGTTAEVDYKTVKPCYPTARSHLNQIPADTKTWEQAAAFRLEQAADEVRFYARNEGLGFVIPYEYVGVSHPYEPDYLVRLANGTTLILEIKGLLTDDDKAKHQAAQRWRSAVNNWGQCGRWEFHVCRDPQTLGHELRTLVF
ncbi:MAG: DEAD/DEAH box helicase family protein [Chloroflexota bacterium]|nr:DEAD/DEAH box helicase family protein [Chloroflexota bacterium]